jgi:ribulose-phosphate 3-epimerase
MPQLAASILSADFANIEDAVRLAEEAGADLIHLDIMDGHFVPNLTTGPQLVASIREKTKLPLDVHLMVEEPAKFIPLFAEAGADWISIHIEASVHLHKDLHTIKEFQKKAGLVLNPATPLHLMSEIIHELDYILLMTVNPGWGGQSFIESCHTKIKNLHHWIKSLKLNTAIEIDGGVKYDNMEKILREGADILVVGSGIYNSKNPREVVRNIKELMKKFEKR